jgi:hypothetical protein
MKARSRLLSSAQICVLEKMVNNWGAVIRENKYYNHQEVRLKGKTIHCFKRPTLDFLVRQGFIVKATCGLYDLNPDWNFKALMS